jgi:hypothetical protein
LQQAYADSNAETTYPHSDTPHANSVSNSVAIFVANPYANSHGDPYRYGNAHGDPYRYGNTNCNAHGHPYGYRYTNCNGNAYGYRYSNGDCYTNPHAGRMHLHARLLEEPP